MFCIPMDEVILDSLWMSYIGSRRGPYDLFDRPGAQTTLYDENNFLVVGLTWPFTSSSRPYITVHHSACRCRCSVVSIRWRR